MRTAHCHPRLLSLGKVCQWLARLGLATLVKDMLGAVVCLFKDVLVAVLAECLVNHVKVPAQFVALSQTHTPMDHAATLS